MKVLVADKFPETAIERLRANGFEVRYEPDLTADKIAGTVAGQNALVV